MNFALQLMGQQNLLKQVKELHLFPPAMFMNLTLTTG